MNRKDLLKTIISDNQSQELPKIWPRKLTIPMDSGKIITLAGVRRSGKTYHLFHLIQQLKKQGVSSERILYLNFEDERLNLTTEELDLILQSYRELYPDIDLADCYFFFDEIQEASGWEKFITRLYNTVSKRVFITGSNATFLSAEIATALRGRTITFELYPLSFREFIDIVAPKVNPHKSSDKAKLANLFKTFMYQGGFPEVVQKDELLQNKILQGYLDVMVLRDLIERYHISQAAILKYFCKRVISSSAGEFSVHKIYNELKSQGYKISKDTIYAYQQYVEAIYLTRFIPKYTHSVIKTELSQKKSYVIDQGLGTALDFKLAQDKGRLLETTLMLELFKQGKHIAYVQNGSQCDFVIIEKGRVIAAIQVAYDLADEQTKEREIKGLVQTCEMYDLNTGTILTFDQTDEFESHAIKINILPAWRYFY
ncbi:ATP-binding protein [Candidatus Woesebacteria bacterium]|nr:ATP-binding protein [Candidatus Woesebacteria bacterium]